jgi:hypothetical protein
MKIIAEITAPPEILADGDAVIESLVMGKPLDARTRDRIRARGRKLTEEIRRQYGEMTLAAELIRESRDE